MCPDGFIPVPGGFILADGSTVDDFCVMKYEAKDVGGVATSQPELTPWVSINQTDAIAECQSQGWELISDQQWMVLAENILNTPINDLDSSTNDTQLATGHSDSSPSGAQASLETEDPIVTGCDLNQPADSLANVYIESSCEIQGSGSGSKGYYNTGNSFSGMYNLTSTGGRDEMRTHVLSNGQVVWDLAGNVLDWTSTLLPLSSCAEGWYDGTSEYWDCFVPIDYTYIPWMRPSQESGSSSGFGYSYMLGGPDVRTLRGGHFSDSFITGVFSVFGFGWSSYSVPSVGFRCVYQPN